MTFKKENGMMVVAGEDSVLAMQMMSQIKFLELEEKTGIVMSKGRSLLASCRDQYCLESRTKKAAIVEMKELFNEKFSDFYEV